MAADWALGWHRLRRSRRIGPYVLAAIGGELSAVIATAGTASTPAPAAPGALNPAPARPTPVAPTPRTAAAAAPTQAGPTQAGRAWRSRGSTTTRAYPI